MSEEKIIIDANDSPQSTNIKSLEELKHNLNGLSNELNFTIKTLDAKVVESKAILEKSATDLDAKIKEFGDSQKLHEVKEQNLIKELNTFSLLPDKLSNSIKGVVPDIAEALDMKLKQNMDVTRQQFDSLNQEMILRVQDQQEKISQLTAKLIQESSVTIGNNWRIFFIRLLVIIIVTIGVSAGTSYLVTVKYPRFIEITGAHDVKVQDSEVKIWGQVKDLKKEEARK